MYKILKLKHIVVLKPKTIRLKITFMLYLLKIILKKSKKVIKLQLITAGHGKRDKVSKK